MLTTKSKNDQSFKARANVNFSIPLYEFKEMEEFVKLKLSRLPKGTNDIPDRWFYTSVRIGQELMFGESLVIDQRTGIIESYPKEVYDKYAAETTYLPGETVGNVDRKYAEAMNLLPKDMQPELVKRKDFYKASAIPKPFLEIVE